MKVAVIRGSYFNKFEMQNYELLANRFQLTGFSGTKTIHNKYIFPLIKLFSPVDLPNFPYKMPLLNRIFLGDAMYLFGLENKLKGFDVAHVRETYFNFTQQALNAKAKGFIKKVVCSCSETIPFNHEGIWRRKAFKQRAIKEVDLFHCLTNKARECLITEGCDPKKIVVFPYGIDLKRFKIHDSSLPGGGQGFKDKKYINILFVGRLVKEKGIYDLLKAFIQLNKKYDYLRLTIVGDGPEKENLIRLIRQIGLIEQIKIIQASYQQMPAVYQKADIFCLLSKPTKYWEEYFGMAIIEAMACSLPIVTTSCGALEEVLGNDMWLVKPSDWDSASKLLEKMIVNHKLRKAVGLKNYLQARQRYDCIKISNKISILWQRSFSTP